MNGISTQVIDLPPQRCATCNEGVEEIVVISGTGKQSTYWRHLDPDTDTEHTAQPREDGK